MCLDFTFGCWWFSWASCCFGFKWVYKIERFASLYVCLCSACACAWVLDLVMDSGFGRAGWVVLVLHGFSLDVGLFGVLLLLVG